MAEVPKKITVLTTSPVVSGFGGDELLFDIWNGPTNMVQDTIDKWQRLGQAGSNYQITGSISAPTTVQAIKFYTSTNIDMITRKKNFFRLKGLVVKVVDDFGTTYTPCIILNASAVAKPITGMGCNFALMCSFTYELQSNA